MRTPNHSAAHFESENVPKTQAWAIVYGGNGCFVMPERMIFPYFHTTQPAKVTIMKYRWLRTAARLGAESRNAIFIVNVLLIFTAVSNNNNKHRSKRQNKKTNDFFSVFSSLSCFRLMAIKFQDRIT